MESWMWEDSLRITILGYNYDNDTTSVFTKEMYLEPMLVRYKTLEVCDQVFIICSPHNGGTTQIIDVCFGLRGKGECIFKQGGVQTISFMLTPEGPPKD